MEGLVLVNRYTRATENGKDITCPHCKYCHTVYRLSWTSLICEGCNLEVGKYEFLHNPTNKKLVIKGSPAIIRKATPTLCNSCGSCMAWLGYSEDQKTCIECKQKKYQYVYEITSSS
jgi:uncharacterized protein (DUF983 family)